METGLVGLVRVSFDQMITALIIIYFTYSSLDLSELAKAAKKKLQSVSCTGVCCFWISTLICLHTFWIVYYIFIITTAI